MSKFVNTVGLYRWFPETEEKCIHPEDLEAITKFYPYGKVFFCCGTEGDYIYLSYGEKRFRVKPERYQKIESDGYFLGETVEVMNGSAEGKKAKINEMDWHYKQQKIMYVLKVDNKLRSRRYWKSDFRKVDIDC